MRYSREQISLMVVNAYKDARKNERHKDSQLRFEEELEKNISLLSYELYTRKWKPSQSICFVITDPTVREVFAPQFRDRVVSHVLFSLVSPIFERQFINDSYSCRKGKGTLYGIERLEHHIRSESENYSKEVYALSMDIEGYFIHINKLILFDEIKRILEKARRTKEYKDLDYDFIYYLVRTILANSPAENCLVIASKEELARVPYSKSLRNVPIGVGLAIGDIMSQLFSNVYLNMLDQYVKRELKATHYCRYVDDFKIISTDADYLKDCESKIRTFLDERLKLVLHRKKTKITSCRENLFFLGACIRNGRKYPIDKVLKRMNAKANELKKYQDDQKKMLEMANSILGYLSQFDSYNIRKEIYEKYIAKTGLFINEKNYYSVCLKG